MKILKLMVLVLAVSILSLCSAVSAESQYNMFAYWVRGPVRTNQLSSPAYDAWSSNMVWKLYTTGSLASDDVGYRLMTEYITQPLELNSNTLHLAVRIVGKNGAKVALNMLRFREVSTDAANTLANLYDLVGITNLVYNYRALGVNYGNGGSRVSDAIDNSGNGSLLKDEIVFIGMQSRYYLYSSSTNLSQIDGYIHSPSQDFRLTGSCEVVGTNGVVLGLVQRTLQVRGEPIPPILSIRNGLSSISIGINMETNRTAVILLSLNVGPNAQWKLESTMNANDLIFRPTTNILHQFFRAVLE